MEQTKQTKTRKIDNSGKDVTTSLLNRAMPQSPEAEAAVLGSMMLDSERIGSVVQQLSADSFYHHEHQIIFSALVGLWESVERNTKIDLVMLRDELVKKNQLKEIGGAEYLATLARSTPSPENIDYYAGIVKEKQLVRELISVTTEILNEAFETGGLIGEKLDKAEQKIFAVTQKKITGEAEHIGDLLTQAFEAIEKRDGRHITGLATGFRQLDEMTCGLQNGEMIIIAGRPSMGKTSFAMNVAEHIGADNDNPVVIFSLEMSRQQLAERLLCSRGHIDSSLVRKGLLNEQQHAELINTAGEMHDKPIYIDDTPGLTPLEMRAKCRRLQSRHEIRAVFIDYLQLMALGGRVESRQQEISTISRYLKAMARELEVPVVVLSQLNRSPEQREGHRPRMSDLRESGSLEQDADVIMLLHREDYYHRGEQDDYEQTNTADIIIAKQRNGPTGTVSLMFNSQFTRFENLAMDFVGEGY